MKLLEIGTRVYWSFLPGLVVETTITDITVIIQSEPKNIWHSVKKDGILPAGAMELNRLYRIDAPIGHDIYIAEEGCYSEAFTTLSEARRSAFKVSRLRKMRAHKKLRKEVYDRYVFIFSTHETPYGFASEKVKREAHKWTKELLSRLGKIYKV